METCPVCEKDIDVCRSFMNEQDYATYFFYDCEHCGAKLNVDVEAEPIFNIKLQVVEENRGQKISN